MNYTTEIFIKKAIEIHGNRYDYSKTECNRLKDKVTIICPEHGEFCKIADNHLFQKSGCKKCYQNKINKRERMTNDKFVRLANEKHLNKYNYSKSNCTVLNKEVSIICDIHGEFFQNAYQHLLGSGCPKCFGNARLSKEEFILKAIAIHGLKYDYSQIEYKNNKANVTIICPNHGEFIQTPNTHLDGYGCQICSESLGEKEISNILIKLGITFEREVIFDNCKNKTYLRFDFFIRCLNILIEFQGRQHYEAIEYFGGAKQLEDNQNRDKIKRDFAKSNGYLLLEIPYWEFKNIEKILKETLNKTCTQY